MNVVEHRSAPAVLLFIVGCLIVIAAQPIRRNSIVGIWTDDAYYIARAESIAMGAGMRQLEIPGAPPDRLAPPGYPLLLTPIAALFPGSVLPMQLLSLALHVLSFLLVYRYSSAWLGPWPSLAVATLYGLHIEPLSISVQVMSETAYTCVVLVSLLLLERDYVGQSRDSIAAWLTVSAAILIKVIGVALAGAMLVLAVWHGKWRASAATGLILAGTFAWLILANRGAEFSSTTYLGVINSDSRPILERFASNSLEYVWELIPFVVIPGVGGDSATIALERLGIGFASHIAKLTLLALVVIGWMFTARSRVSVGHVWVVLHLAVLACFIVVSSRYLIAVLPLLYLYLFVGIDSALKTLPSSLRVRSVSSVAGLLAIVFSISFSYQYWRRVSVPIETRVFDPRIGTEWLRDHVASTAPILYNDVRSGFLYTGRPVVPIPSGSDGPISTDLICSNGIEHVIVTPLMVFDSPWQWSDWAERVLVPDMEQSSDVQLLYESESRVARVYEIGAGYCRGWN